LLVNSQTAAVAGWVWGQNLVLQNFVLFDTGVGNCPILGILDITL